MEEEATFYRDPSSKIHSSGYQKPKSFFLQKENAYNSIKKAQKVRKVFKKCHPKPVFKKNVQKSSKRRLPRILQRPRFVADDLISSPLSEPYDFQSSTQSDFSSLSLGSMIGQISLAFSDSEGYTQRSFERFHSLFESSLQNKLNSCIEKMSSLKNPQDDEDITSCLRKLNL